MLIFLQKSGNISGINTGYLIQVSFDKENSITELLAKEPYNINSSSYINKSIKISDVKVEEHNAFVKAFHEYNYKNAFIESV